MAEPSTFVPGSSAWRFTLSPCASESLSLGTPETAIVPIESFLIGLGLGVLIAFFSTWAAGVTLRFKQQGKDLDGLTQQNDQLQSWSKQSQRAGMAGFKCAALIRRHADIPISRGISVRRQYADIPWCIGVSVRRRFGTRSAGTMNNTPYANQQQHQSTSSSKPKDCQTVSSISSKPAGKPAAAKAQSKAGGFIWGHKEVKSRI